MTPTSIALTLAFISLATGTIIPTALLVAAYLTWTLTTHQ